MSNNSIENNSINNDSYLINKCKKGDRHAFDKLIDKYQDKIFNFAYRITGNYEEASDVSQEAFIRAFNSIKTFRNEAAFSSWMYRIVKNIYIDRLHVAERLPYISLDETIESENGSIQREIKDVNAISPENELIKNERERIIHDLLNELPPHQRIPLVLYHINNLTYEEIANITKLPIGTVKSRINRARSTMAEKIRGNKEPLY